MSTDNNAAGAAPEANANASIHAASVKVLAAQPPAMVSAYRSPVSTEGHDTGHYYVVAALDASTTARAMGLLEDPPAAGKYDTLRTLLLQLFELSEMEKADRLLSLNGLGDNNPSDLMEKMERIPLSFSRMFSCDSCQHPCVLR